MIIKYVIGQLIKIVSGNFEGEYGFITGKSNDEYSVMLMNGIEMMVEVDCIVKDASRMAWKRFIFTPIGDVIEHKGYVYQIMKTSRFYILYVKHKKTDSVSPAHCRIFLTEDEPKSIIASFQESL
ncbi:hypothetical protein [Brevibacillus laterosporus]|uniref:hypothetical protein n=1 Tax=Brevibacillus laterosporus TaxID=1465 RepID=UPI000E6CAFE8|nr:hypothetical protein [Brevibacillus laterosporus]AYB37550.1 hypothetical protein D5F52_04230 [Brevibacillus laterosporus]MBM7111337.1 hypothetical protein [Brevibacillus laterosporus]